MERRWVKASKPYLPLGGGENLGFGGKESRGGGKDRGEGRGGKTCGRKRREGKTYVPWRQGEEERLIVRFLGVFGHGDWRRM